ncbi:SPT3 Dosage dependent suppressor of Ty-induced promoter mutations-like protein [Massospora cicadina]|nr:SPT3 Dosage dependent suppressor of Ty-induced promoter mutations-like protein [Massospora cicadina]
MPGSECGDDFLIQDLNFDTNSSINNLKQDDGLETPIEVSEATRLNQELLFSCNSLRAQLLSTEAGGIPFRSTPASPTALSLRHNGPPPTPLVTGSVSGIFSAPISPRLNHPAGFAAFPYFYFEPQRLDPSLSTLYHHPIVTDAFSNLYFPPHLSTHSNHPLGLSDRLSYLPAPTAAPLEPDQELFYAHHLNYLNPDFGGLEFDNAPNSAEVDGDGQRGEVSQGNTSLDHFGNGLEEGSASSNFKGCHQVAKTSLDPPPLLRVDLIIERKLTMLSFTIKVSGLPPAGARSRVETQIKLCLQLVALEGSLPQEWTHIRLPYFMTVGIRDKRVSQGCTHRVNEAQILNLRVWVVCASDPKRRVTVCNGCIQRERKRYIRRPPKKVGSKPTDSNASSPLSEGNSVEREQKKVVVFNCSKLLSFYCGNVILPTRITCYCRHHQENVGFVIKFAMFDHQGDLVATGMTPPVMITDDHKQRIRTKSHQPPPAPLNATVSSQLPLELSRALAGLVPHWPDHITHNSPEPSPNSLPTIAYIVPTHGPIEGGIEVAILGEHFFGESSSLVKVDLSEGMVVYFGSVPSSVLKLWSPHSAVCLLPPAAKPATVPISIGSLQCTLSTANSVFTYHCSSYQQKLASALQMLSYHHTGRLEEPDVIATRVLGAVAQAAEPRPHLA